MNAANDVALLEIRGEGGREGKPPAILLIRAWRFSIVEHCDVESSFCKERRGDESRRLKANDNAIEKPDHDFLFNRIAEPFLWQSLVFWQSTFRNEVTLLGDMDDFRSES